MARRTEQHIDPLFIGSLPSNTPPLVEVTRHTPEFPPSTPMKGSKKRSVRAVFFDDESTSDIKTSSQPSMKRQKRDVLDMEFLEPKAVETELMVHSLNAAFPSQTIDYIHNLLVNIYLGDYDMAFNHLMTFINPGMASEGYLLANELTGSMPAARSQPILQQQTTSLSLPGSFGKGSTDFEMALGKFRYADDSSRQQSTFPVNSEQDLRAEQTFDLVGTYPPQQLREAGSLKQLMNHYGTPHAVYGQTGHTYISTAPREEGSETQYDVNKPIQVGGESDCVSSPMLGVKPPRTRKPRKSKAAGSEGLVRSYDYLKNTPHRDSELPAISVTAVELLVFLGHSILSWPIANRLISNGMTYALHQYIVRRHRAGSILDASAPADKISDEDEQLYSRNSILHSYQHALRAGKEPGSEIPNWKYKNHRDMVNNQDVDPDNVSLAGFKPRAMTHYQNYVPPLPVPLESLLRDVEHIPKGSDAADLTKAVVFASKRPGIYQWPIGVEKALRDAGGPVKITAEHTDVACIQRWLGTMAAFRRESSRLKRQAAKTLPPSSESDLSISTVPFVGVASPQQSEDTGSCRATSEQFAGDPYLDRRTDSCRLNYPTTEIKPGSVGQETQHDTTGIQSSPLRAQSARPLLLRDLPDPARGDNGIRARNIKFAKHSHFRKVPYEDTPEGHDQIAKFMETHRPPQQTKII